MQSLTLTANSYYFQTAFMVDLVIFLFKEKYTSHNCVCLPGNQVHKEIVFSWQLPLVSQFYLCPCCFSHFLNLESLFYNVVQILIKVTSIVWLSVMSE